jgi:hypothetical protein
MGREEVESGELERVEEIARCISAVLGPFWVEDEDGGLGVGVLLGPVGGVMLEVMVPVVVGGMDGRSGGGWRVCGACCCRRDWDENAREVDLRRCVRPSSRICRLIRRKHCEQALGEAMGLEKCEYRPRGLQESKYPIGDCRERHEIYLLRLFAQFATPPKEGRVPEKGNDI